MKILENIKTPINELQTVDKRLSSKYPAVITKADLGNPRYSDHATLEHIRLDSSMSASQYKSQLNVLNSPSVYMDTKNTKNTKKVKSTLLTQQEQPKKLVDHLPKEERTKYMNELTQAGVCSYKFAKSQPALQIKGQNELTDGKYAWGGPYKLPSKIVPQNFSKIIHSYVSQQQPIFSDEQIEKQKSLRNFWTESRNLNDFATYTGEFENRVPQGYGMIVFDNGEGYRGMWKLGLSHGKGLYITQNGNGYYGEFKDGLADGKGHLWTWDWVNGRALSFEQGEWTNGKWITKK